MNENEHESDLRAATLYHFVLEKMPDMLLCQYYRWAERTEEKSLKTLTCWIGEEAEYQMHAAESKHGFSQGRENRNSDERQSNEQVICYE